MLPDRKICPIQLLYLSSDDLKNYKAKAEYYVRQHQDNEVIAKLKGNVPLKTSDIKELEKILWSEVGSKSNGAPLHHPYPARSMALIPFALLVYLHKSEPEICLIQVLTCQKY